MPDGALRVEFDRDIALKDLADLVAAEQGCCPFFAFTITITMDVRGVGLEIRAPEDAGGLVEKSSGPAMRSPCGQRPGVGFFGLGAVACAVCCAGPILAFVGG